MANKMSPFYSPQIKFIEKLFYEIKKLKAKADCILFLLGMIYGLKSRH